MALGLAEVLLFISFNWHYKVIFVRLAIAEGAYPTAQAWKIDQRSAYFENFEHFLESPFLLYVCCIVALQVQSVTTLVQPVLEL